MHDPLLIDSILDLTPSYACVIDAECRIVNISSSFAGLLGHHDRETLIGKVASESIREGAELKVFFEGLLQRYNDTAIPGQVVQPVYRNSEKPLWIKFDTCTVHSTEKGLCTLIIGTDISAEINARRDAEQRARERSSFLVRMGHELRTPLNTVLGYAQLLQGLGDLTPVAREYVNTIISNEYSLLHLLNDIFELSKYEAGQSAAVLSETNIKKLLNEVTRSYIDQFNTRYLSLTVDYAQGIPEIVQTDPQKVTQILSNIIGNALKFTRKGGVTISVSYDKKMIIDIEDTGSGIPAEEQSQIFELFSQAGISKEHMTGAGIGLAVARIFARMLDGDVVLIRSKEGSGSLFRFTFDPKTVSLTSAESQQITDYTEIKGISRPCKVLLVDDVDINLAMLEIFLAPAGFIVETASNGNEAVRKFRDFGPDIVFMDLIMPEKDGFEATIEIKEINRAVPVIALTASIVDSVKKLALESGVNDFMSKPFVPERFFEIIAEHTGITYRME